MSILLIRHGETDWNAAGRIQGRTDIPLNAAGALQAEALANALKQEGTDFCGVYASALCRAARTGGIIADALGVPCTLTDALSEISFGDWEGRSWREIRETDEKALELFEQGGMDARAPNGESYREMLVRVVDALLALPEAGNYIAVSHGGVIRALKNLLANAAFSYRDFDSVGNASVTRVERAALLAARERLTFSFTRKRK